MRFTPRSKRTGTRSASGSTARAAQFSWTSRPFNQTLTASSLPRPRRPLRASGISISAQAYATAKVGVLGPVAKLTTSASAFTRCHASSLPPMVTFCPGEGATPVSPPASVRKSRANACLWTALSGASLASGAIGSGESTSHERKNSPGFGAT